jgi:hypothetical protein
MHSAQHAAACKPTSSLLTRRRSISKSPSRNTSRSIISTWQQGAIGARGERWVGKGTLQRGLTAWPGDATQGALM